MFQNVFPEFPSVPETNSEFTPENGCWEDEISFWGKRHISRGELLVSGKVIYYHEKIHQTSVDVFFPQCTPSRTTECPLKMDYFNREYIFQPLIFRGYVNFLP